MGVFFFYTEEGIEPIAVQQSGGLLLTPVQTLVATIISARRKCKSIPVPVADLFISRQEAQTRRSAAVRWTAADTSANTGVYNNFRKAEMQIDSRTRG